MKNLFNNKWAWAVLILIIINIATIGAMWCSMSRHGDGHHRGEGFHQRGERGERGGTGHKDGKGGDFLTRELNLTPAQQTSFEELRTTHFKNMHANFEEMKTLKKEVIEHLGKPETEVEPIFQKIGALEIAIQKETFDHFNKMYALCTDSQKVQLKEKLSNIMEHRGKGFHGGGRGEGRGRDGFHKHDHNRGGVCTQENCAHKNAPADSTKHQ